MINVLVFSVLYKIEASFNENTNLEINHTS